MHRIGGNFVQRKLENDLFRWLTTKNRKPLVLRGARQVGKSTLVRNFAHKHALKLYEVNLERHAYLEGTFSSFNLGHIFIDLETVLREKIYSQDSILFLDEIQAVPSALPSLRYFYEEKPDLAVVAAGSLLEFTLSDHSFSMPVGRIQYLQMGPMDFEEYLLATEPYAKDFLDQYTLFDPIPDTMHTLLSRMQREYLFVGGMPEAVQVFATEKSLALVGDIHDSIISTYYDDFGKYASRMELSRLQRLFTSLPRHVGKKIVYSRISRDDQSRDIKKIIDLLANARIITKAYHTDGNGIPLGAEVNENLYKVIFLDVGLYNYLCNLQWSVILEMDRNRLVNEGYIAEQFIGQNLRYAAELGYIKELYYWLREGKTGNAEIDFLINRGTIIFPVEVKSGKSGTLRSIIQFIKSKKGTRAIRFDLNRPSIQNVTWRGADGSENTYALLSLPLYLVNKLVQIVDTWLP